jgi:hypothetical protein
VPSSNHLQDREGLSCVTHSALLEDRKAGSSLLASTIREHDDALSR